MLFTSIYADHMFSVQELKLLLHHVPEIVELVGIGTAGAEQFLSLNDEEMRAEEQSPSCSQLMSASKERVAEVAFKLRRRLESQSQVSAKVGKYFMLFPLTITEHVNTF